MTLKIIASKRLDRSEGWGGKLSPNLTKTKWILQVVVQLPALIELFLTYTGDCIPVPRSWDSRLSRPWWTNLLRRET